MDYRDKIRKRDCLLMGLMYTASACIWWYLTFQMYQTPEDYTSLVRVGVTCLGFVSVVAAGLNWYRWFMYDRKK